MTIGKAYHRYHGSVIHDVLYIIIQAPKRSPDLNQVNRIRSMPMGFCHVNIRALGRRPSDHNLDLNQITQIGSMPSWGRPKQVYKKAGSTTIYNNFWALELVFKKGGSTTAYNNEINCKIKCFARKFSKSLLCTVVLLLFTSRQLSMFDIFILLLCSYSYSYYTLYCIFLYKRFLRL